MKCEDCKEITILRIDGLCSECYKAKHEEVISNTCLEGLLDELLNSK